MYQEQESSHCDGHSIEHVDIYAALLRCYIHKPSSKLIVMIYMYASLFCIYLDVVLYFDSAPYLGNHLY